MEHGMITVQEIQGKGAADRIWSFLRCQKKSTIKIMEDLQMKKIATTTVMKTFSVMVCIAMLSLGPATEGIASLMPGQDRAFCLNQLPLREQRDLDPLSSGIPENPETKVLRLATNDTTTGRERVASPPGGSVWEKAIEGTLGAPRTGGGGSSGSGGSTGGRLVDPDRDVKWGDGTVTPDALRK